MDTSMPNSTFYKQMLDHLAEGVYFVDRERQILYWNRTAEEISGYPAAEVVGRNCHDGILDHRDEHNNSLCEEYCPLVRSMETGRSVEKRVFLKRRDGLRLPVNVRVVPIRDDRGEIVGAVEVFHDVSAELEVERLNEELKQLVRVDALTGIPNRMAIDEAIEREYQRFLRYGTPFALVYADIDFFKSINDRYGHLVGDHALRWFAGRLQMSLRRTDLVGRYGGEEFLVLLSATRLGEGVALAEQLRSYLMQKRFPETGEAITASFGVAEICAGETPEILLDKADRAMYRAKQEGRNRVVSAHECESPPGSDRDWQREHAR